MADDEKDGEETSTRGNEWEVVHLTASTYAAAPSAPSIEPTDDDKDKEFVRDGRDSSHAMFMSQHFVFPPNEHENLPLEPDNSEILIESGTEDADFIQPSSLEEGDKSNKGSRENWNIKELPVVDELHGIHFCDEKGKNLSVYGTGFQEVKAFHGLNLAEEERDMCGATESCSFHGEADINESTACLDSTTKQIDPSRLGLYSSDLSSSQKPTKEDKNNGSGLPCEAWWKRRAASIYSHAKEANAFWSVVVAAAVMGLVLIGQRWQQERWQIQQLRWQVCINDKKISRVVGPLSRFKDVLVGGQRRIPFIRGSTSADH